MHVQKIYELNSCKQNRTVFMFVKGRFGFSTGGGLPPELGRCERAAFAHRHAHPPACHVLDNSQVKTTPALSGFCTLIVREFSALWARIVRRPSRLSVADESRLVQREDRAMRPA